MKETSKASKGLTLQRTWRDFRFLIVILSVWGILGAYEISRTDLPKSRTDVPPEWLLDDQVNLSRTLLELYPNRSMGFFMRSYQAGMCWDNSFQLPVCRTFPHKSLQDVRDALQNAVELGGASNNEELFHFYAFILAQMDEDPQAVNQAVAQWRRNYPYSMKPDPRDSPKKAAPGAPTQ